MLGDPLGALWAEPRPPQPPARVWRDWVLVAVLVAWSLVEMLLREDLAWRPVVLTVAVVVALALLWRRTHPLAAVVAAFGALTAVDVARILAAGDTGLLWSIAGALVLPYALFRWGSGREAVVGLGVILAWLAVTNVADPTGPAEVVAVYGFFLFSAALGASILSTPTPGSARSSRPSFVSATSWPASCTTRWATTSRPSRSRPRPDAPWPLPTPTVHWQRWRPEEAASKTLEEMRAMVGVLRDGADPDFSPQPGVGDIERLSRRVGRRPRVDVQLSGDLDGLSPSLGTALYRIAQESVTNAVRHARHATLVSVRVADDGEEVRLTVRDDGEASSPAAHHRGTALSA